MFLQVLFFLLFASPLLSYNCDYTPSDVGQQADVVTLDSAEQTISRQICSTVTLKCMSPQSNRLFMFWSVNDVIMFSNDKPVIPLDEFKYGAKIITDGNSNILGGELTIRSINETDDATYSCQVPAGTKFKLHLNVLVPPGTLALTLTIKSGTPDILREGNQITLTCFSEGGNPRPNLLWRRGDVLLDASLYKWEGSGGKFGRTFSTLQWTLRWDDHQTEFRCFDDKATISASKTLSVLCE
ncbi:hypothetical protein HELRODRAFT_162667 [Helobdella robusta]|uniref:Ig-like domain-containing protein n=1 Tax=Helobdella robusta TaxID=6412 RepID=T1ESZ7_HELRO|nr:hypothetical protein HELRODRAFT_162667 [Helobdella robusta]ESN99172.1 hypothetical protein HELRODRAFT_162667 [Helobdella robusta]